jgi:hypothetical protein
MATEHTSKNPLERAICERDRALVVRFVAEGYKLSQLDMAAEMGYGDFPPAVVMLVRELALTSEQREMVDSYWWNFRYGKSLWHLKIKAFYPMYDKPDEAEKKLIDAVVRANSAAVVELLKEKPGTLRCFSPELLIMLPELTREATLAFLTDGFIPAVVPELFAFLLREADEPDVLADLPYRKRLMYANLLIHILQGEAPAPDEDWYPMGNSIEDGCDRSVYCRPHSFCYDPRHRYRPRSVDDEYEKTAHEIVRHGSNQEKPQ